MPDRPTDPDAPLTPDELEQRQLADGTFEPSDPIDEVPDRPLTADELEQRQVVEDDEDDYRSE